MKQIKSGLDAQGADVACYFNYTNRHNKSGLFLDALQGADVFISVNKGNLLETAPLQAMADPIVFVTDNIIPNALNTQIADKAGSGGER